MFVFHSKTDTETERVRARQSTPWVIFLDFGCAKTKFSEIPRKVEKNANTKSILHGLKKFQKLGISLLFPAKVNPCVENWALVRWRIVSGTVDPGYEH